MTVIASNTIWVGPRPSSSGPSSQIVATASAGMVRPMLAMAEPSARLRLICTRLRRAALTAARVSGASTRMAMTTPTKDGGRPTAVTAVPIAGESTLASPTTATSETSSRPTLSFHELPGGGSWLLSSSRSSPCLSIGRKNSRCRRVWVRTNRT